MQDDEDVVMQMQGSFRKHYTMPNVMIDQQQSLDRSDKSQRRVTFSRVVILNHSSVFVIVQNDDLPQRGLVRRISERSKELKL
ncbi:hypothetical protein PHYBLDRAFT_143167 [Phycomyces blakesleeanus NRRL 1555(-)]|uniref:Uncharacterized protein n=1 Tax=Phycomyces blakesleeanus (strain ATCC 8743b / DSM 1359 / FGSC 10004 / NBRC 33097 / NRRL 1555) TaxID=763407 RepID=A0A162UH16_PHYB8|nr:hypothetical protein PHYBLDRAFT_143167 [Phycomyces blakesleeanus NRRL 1555(-)]OAD76182.1 hypothetical protein PHYBLDRAFT_143167 [Phycomyces blakesleeanus NRRL 1555(-)]|eukprot:XP_018294222.1 hypothetical protein PHYBLDRAFT_143167 [Phycomyces blakesleeanus NRRL 1555(-)]